MTRSRCAPPALLVLAFAAIATLPTRAQEASLDPSGFKAEALAKLDARIKEAVDRGEVAGAVVVLARKDRLAHAAAIGWRDKEAKAPMTRDSLFRIASMTKPVTSVGIMILADEGKLKLDDPLSKFIPEFATIKVLRPNAEPTQAQKPITSRDLLMHTAGIAYGFIAPKPLDAEFRKAGIVDGLAPAPFDIAENCRRLATVPLLHEPGASRGYGLNTDVLGRVIEVASGMPLDEFFRKRIFEPLKMGDSGFRVPEGRRGRLAALYSAGKDGKVERAGEGVLHSGAVTYSADMPTSPDNKYLSGGAGLVSTADDYARFLQMLLRGGGPLLKPETAKAMTSPQSGFEAPGAHGTEFGYGFGITIPNDPSNLPFAPGTFSWAGIYYTDFWGDPASDLIGVLMTQTFPAQTGLRDDVRKLAYEALEPAKGATK